MKLKTSIIFGSVMLTEVTKARGKNPGKVVGGFHFGYGGDKVELAFIHPAKFFTEEATPPAGVKVDTIKFVKAVAGQDGIGWNFFFTGEVEMTDEQIERLLALDQEVRANFKALEEHRRKIDALHAEMAKVREEGWGLSAKTRQVIFNG